MILTYITHHFSSRVKYNVKPDSVLFFLVITEIIPHLIAIRPYFNYFVEYKNQIQDFLQNVLESN